MSGESGTLKSVTIMYYFLFLTVNAMWPLLPGTFSRPTLQLQFLLLMERTSNTWGREGRKRVKEWEGVGNSSSWVVKSFASCNLIKTSCNANQINFPERN